jgi:hypothetical protein
VVIASTGILLAACTPPEEHHWGIRHNSDGSFDVVECDTLPQVEHEAHQSARTADLLAGEGMAPPDLPRGDWVWFDSRLAPFAPAAPCAGIAPSTPRPSAGGVIGGLLVIGLVLVLPVTLIALILRSWWRDRSRRPRPSFWWAVGSYGTCLVMLTLVVCSRSVDGWALAYVAFLGMPMTLVPTIATSSILGPLMPPLEWVSYGYGIIAPVFVLGSLAWALLFPCAARWIEVRAHPHRFARALVDTTATGPPPEGDGPVR